MIIRSETDLLPSEYEDLLAGRYNPTAKVMVYQYNPAFTANIYAVTGAAANTQYADYDGFGYRIRGSTVEKIAQNGAITDLAYSPPGDWIVSEPLTISADANGVAVFAVCTTGLKRSIYTGSWSTVLLSSIPYTETYNFYTDTIFDSLATYSTGQNAIFAFDNVYTNYWEATSLPAQLGSGTGSLVTTRYTVMSGSSADAAPKSWTFEGWNGSSWVTIDTKSNQPTWFPFETRTYDISNSTAYTRLRINVSAVYSGTTVQVGLLSAVSLQNFSLSPDITLLAAASTEAVFFLREIPQRNLYLLCAAILENGTWKYKESDIYWPGKLDEMKAVPRSGGGYIITAVTLIPGPMTIKSTGAATETYVYKKQGIVSFIFENDTFSDHFEVDVSDFYTGWRKREKMTLMNINGLTYMIALVTDGSEEYPNAMYQVYTTLDGKFWSLGESFYMPGDFSSAVHLSVEQDATVLAMMNYDSYSSPHTRIFGGSAISADLSKYVEGLDVSFGDMGSGSMTIANHVLQYDNNPNFNTQNIYEIEVWAGYNVNGNRVMVRIIKGDVDAILLARNGHERTFSVSFRDFMSRLTDRFKSRNARELRTALVFQDDFTNTIDNVYGGLRNTASQDGQWKSRHLSISGEAGDGVSTTAGEAIAFSTATIDMWNGVHEAWMNFQQNNASGTGSELWFLYYSSEPRKRMETIWGTNEPPVIGGSVNMPIGWTPPYYDKNTDFYGFFIGYIKSKAATGDYNFRLEYTGQASFYINNTLLINGHENPSANTTYLSGTIDLPDANTWYPVFIPFATWPKTYGLSSVKLFWSPPGESEALVPGANLAKSLLVSSELSGYGVIFRAVDKRNFYAVVHEPTNERIILKVRIDGIDRVLDICDIDSLGWDADSESPRKMYVSFRYGRIRVYANNEYGQPNPVLRIDHLLDMRGLVAPDSQGLIPLKNTLPEAGYVGYIGRGV
jgi:hypothetical protein